MEKDGMERYLVKMVILNLKLKREKDLLLSMMILEIDLYLKENI